jgi:hypothetical protein
MFRRYVIALWLASLAIACSSSSASSGPKPCNEDPFECPSGQTCWPESATAFACLNSGPGNPGDACEDAAGTPTCNDGLACLALGMASGTCAPYCDSSDVTHGCPAGQSCQTAQVIGGLSFQVCVGGTPGGSSTATDGGTDAGTD